MNHSSSNAPDLSKWRNVPLILLIAGGALALLGAAVKPVEFAYAWLLSFMFFLSLCLGALFLVMVHHLFDAGWSVPIRRFCEHIAAMLFPWMALLFIPIALTAKTIFKWMSVSPHLDHSLAAKQPLFSVPMFYAVSAFCFLVWWLLSNRLRHWSLEQDKTGAARATYRMRFYSCIGIVLYAITLTLAVIMWMKSLQYQWFSTMYGVYYFAGSVWMTLAAVYVITMILDRQGMPHACGKTGWTQAAVAVFEIDSAVKPRSFQKLKEAAAAHKLWVYFGGDVWGFRTFLQKYDAGREIVPVIVPRTFVPSFEDDARGEG